jgi:hypothetical protein
LNVERVRAEADTTGWTGEIGADFALNKYNDRVIKVGNQANMAYFSHRHAYMLLSSIDLVNVDGNSLVSNGYVHLRSTLLRKESFSPELFVQYQYNNNLGLRNRALAGGGVQYTFLARPNIRGHISTGLMFEHEEWGVDNNTSVENNLIKSTSNLSIRGRINPADLRHRHRVLPGATRQILQAAGNLRKPAQHQHQPEPHLSGSTLP